MKYVLIVATAVTALAWSLNPQAAAPIKVDGGLIEGTEAKGVRVYRGIPYAAPPTGARRWTPPQPVVPWAGVRRADSFGGMCPQLAYEPAVFQLPLDDMSEDCLYLNVWTATRGQAKQPVMVYIHGGGLTRGSGHKFSGLQLSPAYDGAALAKKGVVVVTINYRLGPLGYLAHPELTAESANHSSGNYGTLDQIAALTWVKNNIAAFGGDPAQVTIFGQSAGSWSVNVLSASPLAKGLFIRGIGMSGARFVPGSFARKEDRTLAGAEKNGVSYMKKAGVTSVKALRDVPVATLLQTDGLPISEVVDGWVLPEDVAAIFARRKENPVQVLVGFTHDELGLLSAPSTYPRTLADHRARIAKTYGPDAPQIEALYPVKTDADIPSATRLMQRDASWALEARTWARVNAQHGRASYLYQWTRAVPMPPPTLGAYHGSELQYVFNIVGLLPSWRYTEGDRRMADTVSNYWTNFAKRGDPNGPGLPKWQAYDLTNEPFMDLGDTARPGTHMIQAQLDFFESRLLTPAR